LHDCVYGLLPIEAEVNVIGDAYAKLLAHGLHGSDAEFFIVDYHDSHGLPG